MPSSSRRPFAWREIQPTDRVLDLYCGIGNFSLPLAQRARELIGVEGDAGLVARAVRNAASNGIGNTRFVAADLMSPGWSFYREPWDVVVLDPPRTGAEAPVAELDEAARAASSTCPAIPRRWRATRRCSSEQHGYRLRAVRVFDMFPHTHHVEALALFTRD